MQAVVTYKQLFFTLRTHVKRTHVYITFFVLALVPSSGAYCQPVDSYDEVLITLNVPRIGSLEVSSLINNQTVYLPVKEVFDYLKIKNQTSEDLDSITGFFINGKTLYNICKAKHEIVLDGKIFVLKPDDIKRTESNLYLKSDVFGQVFGLECVFNFRSLSVTLNSKIELPAIREMQQELMHRNLNQLKGEKKADTIIERSFPLFKLGVADWSVISSQQNKVSSTRLNVGLGAMIAGGEANAYLNYTTGQSLKQTPQYYNWRYVNNSNGVLRQATLGKIYVESTSTIYAPITGVQLSNTPTTYRKSFGTYRLSDKTEPGWTVELYINNVLINYTKADASGFFSFDVPMVYGNSSVKLKFYGSWGEERTREESITIPFNFLPVNQFEYKLSAGVLNDDTKSRYSRADLNYGFNKRITFGGGVEYLSSVSSGRTMPFINASARLSSNMFLSAERTYGVRSKGVFTYHHPSNLQVELDYIKYDEGQTAIQCNYLQEKKAIVSVPFHSNKFNAFSRLTLNQITVPKSTLTTGEFLVSTIVAGVNASLTTYATLGSATQAQVYNSLSLTVRLPGGMRITPQAQYEYTQKRVNLLRCEFEKSLLKQGFLNLSYEKSMATKTSAVYVSFRYNFSFAQTSVSALIANHSTTTTEYARGSLMYDSKTSRINANDRSNVGRGGLTLIPYLDLNCNGERDENEPAAYGLRIHTNGGKVEYDNKDTTIHVWGLEPYTNYFIDADKNSFDNIAWQLKKSTYSVAIDPNTIKAIEIPVAVVGEVSGSVFVNERNAQTGMGRMIVNIYNSKGKPVAKTLTESDGYFNYVGLAPGKYTARIEQQQLDKLEMKAVVQSVPFVIKLSTEGDVVEGLKLVITKAAKLD
jgi:hypothetical protein